MVTTPVNASNFTQCLNSVRNGEKGTGRIGATDNEGNILDDVRNATGLTFELCERACGGGAEPFEWSDFSQQFSAWLLPYLALISQLPFGPKKRQDNLESIMLTVGSPTLAAYSLALTVLSREWIATRFSRLNYPNLRGAVLALSNLLQAPLRVSDEGDMLASLIVLPQNDHWWGELNERLQDPHTWSISAVTSIAWVIVAYVFTVVDSFTGEIIDRMKACGQGVGSLWLWLLPIVIGWHRLSPKSNQEHIEDAIDRANKRAYVAAEEHSANQDPVLAPIITERRAIYLAWNQEDERRGGQMGKEYELGAQERNEKDELRVDERNTAPIYNYSRFLPWVESVETVLDVFRVASYRRIHHQSVNPKNDWVVVDLREKPHGSNRVGNRGQIGKYCCMEETPLRRGRSRWGVNVVSRMLIASFMALLLQWGTVGGAIVLIYFTPTTGELWHLLMLTGNLTLLQQDWVAGQALTSCLGCCPP